MGRYIRILIVIAMVLGIVLLARNNTAWARTADQAGQSGLEQEQSSDSLGNPKPGTVKPPPAELTICGEGIYSVGGVSTLEVTDLAPGYCLEAFLRNHAFALGRIPDGSGKVLAQITFLRVFYHSTLVSELPTEDGKVQICYAVPPGKNAKIYFFNFYGARFGERTGQPAWELLETTVENNIACAAAQTTGAYGLIGN